MLRLAGAAIPRLLMHNRMSHTELRDFSLLLSSMFQENSDSPLDGATLPNKSRSTLMSKVDSAPSSAAEAVAYLEANRTEQLSFRQLLDLLGKTVVFSDALIVSLLPRGTLQAVQPQRASEALTRAYAREFHLHDHLSWQAMREQSAVRLTEQDSDRPLASRLLAAIGLKYAVAVPLRGPVLPGYGGALHLYRTVEQGDFDDAELEVLMDLARRIDEAVDVSRELRQTTVGSGELAGTSGAASRAYFFDGEGQFITLGETMPLDDRLQWAMQQEARQRLQRQGPEDISGDRILLADATGDFRTFRVVTYKQYPAMGEGQFVAFFLLPDCNEWGMVRSSDFVADAEVARLVPAMRFMQQEFHRSPTLVEIAKTVHLSPFHFHRRFSELLGLTPKHFLLDCQIFAAKRDLLAGQKELATIASECGFAHQSHFTSRFKQATGLTPTRWRRMAIDRQNPNNL